MGEGAASFFTVRGLSFTLGMEAETSSLS